VNPYRDVTIGIELGARVREAMMRQQDWNEVLHWWAAIHGLKVS
jgi:hypothetical protein